MGIRVMDGDYQGQVGVVLFNHSTKDFVVKAGDNVAQFILEQIKNLAVQKVKVLDDTQRGAGGFGSSGV